MRARRVSLRRALPLAAISALSLTHGCAEAEPPVVWAASIEGADVAAPGAVVRLRIDARPTGAWYFYSLTQPAGGPVPARIWLEDSTTFRQAGPVRSAPPSRTFDGVFGIDVEKYSGATSFILPVRVSGGAAAGAQDIRVNASYQACNDTVCLSPRTVTMTVPMTIAPR